jgi:hypothetical protein
LKIHAHDPAVLESLAAAEVIMDETLHLLWVPGMRDAIHSGMSENLQSTSKKLNW